MRFEAILCGVLFLALSPAVTARADEPSSVAGTSFKASGEVLESTEVWVLFTLAGIGLLAAVAVLLISRGRARQNATLLDQLERAVSDEPEKGNGTP